MVLRAIAEATATAQVEIFQQLDCHSSTRGSSGQLYEKFVHARLTARPSLVPLQCTPSEGNLALTIPVCENVLSFGGVTGLRFANEEEIPFYWRPSKSNFPSLDSIICTDNAILILQATRLRRGRHSVLREGVDTVLKSFPKGFVAAREVYFIFVTDSDDKAKRLREQELPELEALALKVFSCVFRVGLMDAREIDASHKFDVSNHCYIMAVLITFHDIGL